MSMMRMRSLTRGDGGDGSRERGTGHGMTRKYIAAWKPQACFAIRREEEGVDGAEIFEDDEGAERLVRERKAMIVEKAKAD